MVTNYMTPRTHEAISMGTSGNLQGTHNILYLETGLVLKQQVNTVLIMLDQVIKKIN